jgi:hypothetical protein
MGRLALAVILQLFAILLGISVLAGVGLWLTQPWWKDVRVLPLRPCGKWRPYVLPGGDLWCWWPDGWEVREEKTRSGAKVIFDAGDTARVVIVVRADGNTGLSGQSVERRPTAVASRLVAELLWVISRKPGFWHTPIRPVFTRLGEGRGAFFAHWNFAGIRPVPWYGWLCVVASENRLVAACATCAGENLRDFAWPAVRLVKTLKALRAEHTRRRPNGAPVAPQDAGMRSSPAVDRRNARCAQPLAASATTTDDLGQGP